MVSGSSPGGLAINPTRLLAFFFARPCHQVLAKSTLLRFATLLLPCILAFFRTRKERAIVELALRQQLAAYAQRRPRPRLTFLDRAFWVALHRLWPRRKEVLVFVKPETVVRWHRKGFRLS
jgi:hypothetical protein